MPWHLLRETHHLDQTGVSTDTDRSKEQMEQQDEHDAHKNFASRYLCHPNPAIAILTWIVTILLILGLLFACLLLVTYIAFHPKSPKVHIRDIAVRHLGAVIASPTTFFSTALLKADLGLILDVANPNTRLKILFDDIHLNVFFDDIRVGEAVLAGFSQAKRSALASVEKDVESDGVVLPRAVASSLLRALAQQRISFRVVIRVKIRFQIGKLKTPRLKFVERCDLDVRPLATFTRESVLRKNCDSDIKL
ncbi:NDR1/HIN1-like protein 3 [Selaginella moellendorffii]|uniref:NDR1/HIN1-like protein 3 n=1 Tax=Selaginella moellendorffii TaxID=88036 RepID=UPI000D1CB0A9|nr:NDR1/HIN1-like protein 3 [Selaginella moellendorffii]|eukprot:XP_024539043.1 NDR1/HIN1-like protein 3 [Selaginella moellendorffii]